MITIQDVRYILDICREADIPVMLWGETGIGKTAIIQQYCKDNNIPLVSLYAAQIDGFELKGIPYIDNNTVKFAPLYNLPKDKYFILSCEELNRGDRQTIQAMYQLINEKKIGTHKYNCFVVATCNPVSTYIVAELDNALMHRFLHIHITPDREILKTYLQNKYGNCEYLEHVDKLLDVKVPNISNGYTSPRQIEWLFKLEKAQKKVQIPPIIYQSIIKSLFPTKWEIIFQKRFDINNLPEIKNEEELKNVLEFMLDVISNFSLNKKMKLAKWMANYYKSYYDIIMTYLAKFTAIETGVDIDDIKVSFIEQILKTNNDYTDIILNTTLYYFIQVLYG